MVKDSRQAGRLPPVGEYSHPSSRIPRISCMCDSLAPAALQRVRRIASRSRRLFPMLPSAGNGMEHPARWVARVRRTWITVVNHRAVACSTGPTAIARLRAVTCVVVATSGAGAYRNITRHHSPDCTSRPYMDYHHRRRGSIRQHNCRYHYTSPRRFSRYRRCTKCQRPLRCGLRRQLGCTSPRCTGCRHRRRGSIRQHNCRYHYTSPRRYARYRPRRRCRR